MSYACCSFRKHKHRELIWFRVLVLLRGLEVQTLQCSSTFQPQMRIWVWDHLAAPPRLCCTSGRLILLVGGFFFSPQLYLLLVFRTKQIKLNHDRKICWASGINSGFHFPGSHTCPQHRHWEGAGMLLQDRICGCRSDSWGAAGPSHPQQIAAAAEQESWAVLHCRCRSSVLLQFCSAPAPVHPNSSS